VVHVPPQQAACVEPGPQLAQSVCNEHEPPNCIGSLSKGFNALIPLLIDQNTYPIIPKIIIIKTSTITIAIIIYTILLKFEMFFTYYYCMTQTNQYHGKIVQYRDTFDQDQKNEFLKCLPKRSDFIDPVEHNKIFQLVKSKQPILFLPNDIIDQHVKTPDGIRYRPIMVGVLRDGTKAAVVLKDQKPWFDVRVPATADLWSFTNAIKETLKNAECWNTGIETVQLFPGKMFHEKPSDYLRISFNTLFQRKKSLTALRYDPTKSNVIHFNFKRHLGMGGDSLNRPDGPQLETANDDRSCYYRKIARENKIRLAGWNQITNYEIDRSELYVRNYMVGLCIVIDTKDIKDIDLCGIDPMKDPKYKDLIRDRTMVAGWDLETYARHSTGNAPEPLKVFGADGKEEDIVFLEAMPFAWHWAPNPFLQVAITLLPSPPVEDCLIIQVKNQIELIKVKALLYERMGPELLIGFNDGMYDWPFILERAKAYDQRGHDLIKFMKQHMSVIPWDDDNAKFSIRGESKERVKLEAGVDYQPTMFIVPGSIAVDIRGIFMQMYPRAEKTSLNYFLSINKLASKEDMPYTTMFRIVKLVIMTLMNIVKSDDYNVLLNWLKSIQEERGPDYIPFGSGGIRDLRPLLSDSDKDSAYNIDKMTIVELIKLMAGADEGGATNEGVKKVLIYCNVDARKCQDLLRVRNIIPDRREIANLSYTSFGDALYRAGGMKVRNLVMTHAAEAEWNLAFSNISTGNKDDRKYPGAYVVSPKKGLYRDNKIIKRKRRTHNRSNSSLNFGGDTIETISIESVDPASPKFEQELLDDLKHAIVNQAGMDLYQRISNDETDNTDRPCTGLDFSSLYPSLIMTYNLSPEKVIIDRADRDRLERLGFDFIEVNFKYGLKDKPDNEKETILAWIVQHIHPARKILTEEVERAKTIDPVKWNKYMSKEVVDKVKRLYKETTLEQWRSYGMGIYPFILKNLFDKRSKVKKHMEHFAEPKEFMDKIFGDVQKLKDFSLMSIDDQKKRWQELLEQEIKRRHDEYEKTKKGFHKWKLEVIEETRDFFQECWSKIDAEYSEMSLEELFHEMVFKITYYNTIQLALKVFMNTFYGETGNQLSPFFIVAVAGGITTWGQRNTKMVKTYVESELYNVLYGDTDSIYLCCPEYKFAEIDQLYHTGTISKLEYWTRMIEITMETMDEFKLEVNNLLMFDNKSPFLTMAYEEALYPFAMLGKKKYIGVQHQGIVNLAACMPDCTLDEFMNPKGKGRSVFIRGLEIVKRGASDFLKKICYDVFKQSFSISETRTLKEVVENKLREIAGTKWDPSIFAKSAKYKQPGINPETGQKKPGNVSVLKFMDRMSTIEASHPEFGIKVPDWGERFKYIVVKRYPWQYDVRGCQKKISMADRYEFVESMTSKPYQSLIGDLEVDLDYYVTNEIIGQFARFIIYHPDYDHYFKPDMSDEDYKEADAKAWAYAKKTLTEYYEDRYGTKYAKKGKLHKDIFKAVNTRVVDKLYDTYGSAGSLFKLTNQIETKTIGDDDSPLMVHNDILNKLIMEAKKVGEKQSNPFEVAPMIKATSANELETHKWFRKLKLDPFSLEYTCILGAGSYYRLKRDFLQQKEQDLLLVLKKIIPQFQAIYSESLDEMTRIVETVVDSNNLDARGNAPVEIDTEARLDWTLPEINLPDQDAHPVVYQLFDLYQEIVSVYRQLSELDSFKTTIQDLKASTADKNHIPASLKKRSLQEDFVQWLSSNQSDHVVYNDGF
jgi:DNA polymerase elongation subunit (family B)